MSTVDIEVGAQLAGAFTAELRDTNGVPPTDVIRRSDAFSIECTWYLTGGLATSLGGTWYVQAVFGAADPGQQFRTPEISVPLTGLEGAPPAAGYSASISIPAGDAFPNGPAKVPSGDRAEPYQVTVLLNYDDVAGKPGPLAASADLGEVTIYA